MSTEITTAPAKPTTLQEMLKLPAVRSQLSQALPSHCKPDRFLRVVANCIRRVPKLAECDQGSFFNCLLTLSQYGLEPDGRNAHLIPFRNNKQNITECQLIIDYKGLVELAMRSGLISTIHADVVCENDDFHYNMGEIDRHVIDLRKERGEVYAVYAMVKFRDGSRRSEVMSRADVEAIRKRSKSGNNGPWITDWNEMSKKTAFKRLSKWISISAEFRDAVDSDDDRLDTTGIVLETDNLTATERLTKRLAAASHSDADSASVATDQPQTTQEPSREPEQRQESVETPQKEPEPQRDVTNSRADNLSRRINLATAAKDLAQLALEVGESRADGGLSQHEADALSGLISEKMPK